MTKAISITVEVYDGTETEKIENIISVALDSNGIDLNISFRSGAHS